MSTESARSSARPRRTFLCKSHPDFHLPADVSVGEGFDGDAYARRLKESHVDAVAFFAKCHYGHSYYDTKVGCRHPGLKMDMLAEVVRGCRKHGLGIVAYLSVFLDTAAVASHPDWRLQADAGKADAGFDSGNFQPVCVNSPYLEELFIPQSVEVVANYDVDELFYDTMTGFKPCYCANCRRLFGEIPLSSEDPRWLEYVKWYASRYQEFYARSTAAVNAANPAVAVAYNHEWTWRRPQPPVAGIARLGADLFPTGTVASTFCRYFAGTGLPFDYMCGRFLHGLGDWNSSTPQTLLYTGSATVANGGSFYIIDRQLPDGSLEDRAYDMMKEVFGFIQERRPWLEGTRHVPEVAAVHSYDSITGRKLELFPDAKARERRTAPLEGLTRLCIEHGRHFTGLSEDRLAERIGEYRLVIVPEQELLTAKTKRCLADFVQRGGRLLVTQGWIGQRPEPELLELAGVRYDGHDELHYGYFGTTPPLLVRGQFARVAALGDTEVLCPYVAPLAAGQGGKKFGHGFAPPTQAAGRPLVTSRRVGQGEVIYIAAPFFGQYYDYQNRQQARLALSLMDRLLPDPIARIKTEAQVEMCVMRKGDDLIVHLVNHAGRERLGGMWAPCTEYIPPIHDIELSIRSQRLGLDVLSVPSGQSLAARAGQGRTTVSLPPLHAMESVCVPGYFGRE